MTSRSSGSNVDLLIRGGYVLTMDSAGDIPAGDVHVRGGVRQSVGRNLDVPEAELIDACGKIVAPGLVDTHWHMWDTLLRGLSGGAAAGRGDRDGYFAICAALGRQVRPGDYHAGTRLATAEAIDAGITTVHDWARNIRGRDWAEAGLRALADIAALAVLQRGRPHPQA
jgi:5-methylthioadenosine/S-adenosylhomocysteine deaminase